MNQAPLARPAARVLMLDEAQRLLLVRFEFEGERWWAAPGGGVQAGETHEQAARREIYEETGARDFELGPWVWYREHVFPLNGVLYHQQERYYLARVTAFTPRVVHLDQGDEAASFRGLHWWTPEELAATSETLVPRELAALLSALREQGPPAEPITVGR